MYKPSKFNITEAARLVNLSRTSLYKNYINKGILSVNRTGKDIYIELNELLRVFPNIHIDNTSDVKNITEANTKFNIYEQENTYLKEQLKQANEREDWLKSQIDELRLQQSNLLENRLSVRRKKFLGIF